MMQKPMRLWDPQKGPLILWRLLFYALFALQIYPIGRTSLRLATVVGIALLWGGALLLWWRKRWLRAGVLALGCIAVWMGVGPGRPVDAARLRGAYVRHLSFYEGTRYAWGGESRLCIDCSGLVRRAFVDALVWTGLATANPGAVRQALEIWWYDCTARALRDGYRGFTEPVLVADSIMALDRNRVMAGDLAVTSDGVHVLAYLGNGEWIQADPNEGRVVVCGTGSDNCWLQVPVRVVRWRAAK